jgi:hypothetical protein
LKRIILATAISAAVLATACGSASSVPHGQPGASLPPSAACLTAGNCTVAQQQQVAASMGITNPAGLNGCLVAGTCTASQQEGIGAGTSAGGNSSPSSPTPTAAATLSWVCTITSTSQVNSTDWTTRWSLTANNNSSSTADVTNGVTIEFYDQAGDGTESYTWPLTGVIVPSQSQSFTGSDYITSDTAPTTCDVTQWN